MNDTGTVGHGDIAVDLDKMCLLMLLFGDLGCLFEVRLVLLVLQSLAGHALKDLIALAEDLIAESLRHIVGVAVGGLHLYIGLIGVHAKADIGRQGPRCCGPCQEIRILSLCLETDNGGALLDVLIPLSNLMGRKRGAAARAVRHDLEALIKKAFLPDLL